MAQLKRGVGIDWMVMDELAKEGKRRGDAMWIAIDGAAHKTYVDVGKLDTIGVVHVGYGNYKVVGRIGDRDIAIKCKLASEAEAQEWLDEVVQQIMA